MSRLSFWLASTTILAACPLYAQESNVIDLDVIHVTSDEAEDAVVETITSEEIRESGATSAATLFQSIPTVQTSGTSSTGNRIFINGLETNSANVSVDGAPVGSQVWHHGGPGGINPRLFKQVDVYSGITPADIGPFATSGALVFETVDAADLLEDGDDFGGFAGYTFSSNGSVSTYEGSVYGRSGNFDYILSLSTANGGNWDDGNGDEIPLSGTGIDSGLVKLGYDLGEGRRLTFSTTRYQDESDRNIRADLAVGLNGVLVPVPNETITETYTFEYTDDLVEGFFNPEARLTYSKQNQFQDRAAAGLTSNNVDVDSEDTTLKLQNKVAIANGEVRFGLDHLDSTSYSNIGGAGEKITNTGLFVQADADITEQLRVSGGLRYDWTKFEGPVAGGFSTKDDGYSANLYVEYQANDWLTLDGGVSRVFGGYDFGENAGLTSAATYTDGEAEVSKNYRVGFNVSLPNGFFGGAHVFRTKIEHAANSRTRSLAGETLESKGWDADIGYRFHRGIVSLNYTNADVYENGALLAGYSDYSGAPVGEILTLQARYDFENGLVVGGFVEAPLEYDVGGGTKLPSYEVVNIFATYTPPSNDALTVRVGIDNLFDEQYNSRQARSVGSVASLYSEPGRSVSVSVNYTF